uniref:AlNc14C38G3290 protein n=1 Tax=Albugo laibachii Nc14 TaxID=890382 RepID=F0W920_9STRA|nr:AlNc14C38G3290 [Albugo laibachii Nc14]|eukprot:CCA17631.1 AlNc14C38G3290 [Albugo laibachii Nc14]
MSDKGPYSFLLAYWSFRENFHKEIEEMAKEINNAAKHAEYQPLHPQTTIAGHNVASDLPLQCGVCKQVHIVHHAVQNATFTCASCGAQNRILFEAQAQQLGRMRWFCIPVPLFFCNIL